jgi:hypothetical protein
MRNKKKISDLAAAVSAGMCLGMGISMQSRAIAISVAAALALFSIIMKASAADDAKAAEGKTDPPSK